MSWAGVDALSAHMAETDGLDLLAAIADDAGLPLIADASRATAERLRAGLFYVVCVGQFKRGKSTLLNALVGAPLLPTGVVPVTSVVTILRYGERVSARVRFQDGRSVDCEPPAIERYVSEEHNPANVRKAVSVEVAVPSTLLAHGLCLVDTPGLGSVVLENSEATRRFLPHVDAALLVLGSDPPITADELALVREIAPTVRDIVVVFNKRDRSSPAEQVAAIAFTERVLYQMLRHPPGPILQVSATQRLEQGDEAGDWARLLDRLSGLALGSGADLVDAARERETAALIATLSATLDDQHAALLRPIQDSESRLAALRLTVASAERSLNDLAHLLNAEQERLAHSLAEQRDRFFTTALARSLDELRHAVQTGPTNASRLRAHAIEQAQSITHRCLEQWRNELDPAATALYCKAEGRFAELVNGFRERLAETTGLAGLQPLRTAAGFRAGSGFYYTQMMTLAAASPIAWVLDHAFPWWRRRAIQGKAVTLLTRMLEVNSARIKNDFEDRLSESRRRLEREARDALRSVIVTAETAVSEARRLHAAGTAAVKIRLDAIEKLQRRVAMLERRDQHAVDGRLA